MGEQPFLHVTHRLDLIYMYKKYHQYISKDLKVNECTSFFLLTDGQTDARLIAISPEHCWSGDKKTWQDMGLQSCNKLPVSD